MTLVFARIKQGLVGETRRVSHVFGLPEGGGVPERLTALCGASFLPGVLELMAQWTGLPCEPCTLRMADRMPRPIQE